MSDDQIEEFRQRMLMKPRPAESEPPVRVQRLVRRLEVTLVKLSACPCGFPLLKDNIPLGTVYEIDPNETANVTLICGGCKQRQPLKAVWVYAREESQAGFLPESVFSHKTETPNND